MQSLLRPAFLRIFTGRGAVTFSTDKQIESLKFTDECADESTNESPDGIHTDGFAYEPTNQTAQAA
jgi:hypothetical protein